MKRLEYKTVAMPQLLKARRRRGQTRAEMVAEIVSGVINKQAGMGWRYVGTDSFKTIERRGIFGGSQETTYTVLVFDREAQAGADEPEIRSEPRREAARRDAPSRDPVEREPAESVEPARERRRAPAAERGRAEPVTAEDPRLDARHSEPRVSEPRVSEPRVSEQRASEPRPADPTASRRGAFRFGESRGEPASPRENRTVERRRGAPRDSSVEPGWDDEGFSERRPAAARAGRRPVEAPPEPDFGDYSPEDDGFAQPERVERTRTRSYGVGGPNRGRRNKG